MTLPADYAERMAHELKIMEQMGFPTYFLVVWDYIRFARDKNIPVGPGRGQPPVPWWPTAWGSPTSTR